MSWLKAAMYNGKQGQKRIAGVYEEYVGSIESAVKAKRKGFGARG